MSIRFASALLLAGFLLGGCSGSSSDGIGPTNPQSGNGTPTRAPGGVGDLQALSFRPTSGVLPFPTDLYFNGSTDGTLNLPSSVSALTRISPRSMRSTASRRPRHHAAFLGRDRSSDPRRRPCGSSEVEIDNATKATIGFLAHPAARHGLFDRRRRPDHRLGRSDARDPAAAAAHALDGRDQHWLPDPPHERRQERDGMPRRPIPTTWRCALRRSPI